MAPDLSAIGFVGYGVTKAGETAALFHNSVAGLQHGMVHAPANGNDRITPVLTQWANCGANCGVYDGAHDAGLVTAQAAQEKQVRGN